MAGKRGLNVSVSERRDWLDQLEQGASVSDIAKRSGRRPRTIPKHLRQARIERDLRAARSDQLREVLRTHQADLLSLIELTYEAIRVGPISTNEVEPPFADGLGTLETAPSELDPARNESRSSVEFGFGPKPSTPHRDQISRYFSGGAFECYESSPGEVIFGLRVESSRGWKMLREHKMRDPLWKKLESWKNAVLQELQGRWVLNRHMRITSEAILGAPVRDRSVPGAVRLTSSFIPTMRAELLGSLAHGVLDDLYWEGGSLHTRYGQYIIEGAQPDEQDRLDKELRAFLDTVRASDEFKLSTACRGRTQERAEAAMSILDGLLLLNYVPGDCGVCKSLSVV